MSIVQISKIQQRFGNIVDLPQLDEAEFGWASDTKQLFIGKTTPNENIEVLTSYSQINFDQINGSIGNLNISNVTIADGQVLAYDGNNWVNRGGDAGGLINLGEVSNVKISGGAIGYVLETDGLGNLSWTPKSSIISFIQNVTKANPAVVTTTQDNFLTDGLRITITDAQGMTQLNGNSYYANVLSSNTFSLYSDAGLSTTVDTTATTTLSGVTITGTAGQFSCSASSAPLSVGQQITISGTFGGTGSISGYSNPTTYYIVATDGSTTFTLSTTKGGTGVTTTAGTPTGLTYTVSIFIPYSFTSAVSTTASTNIITVGDSALFTVNQEVEFLGDLGNSTLENNVPYYIKTIPGGGITITVSEELLANGIAGNVKSLVTDTLTGASVYATGGRTIATVSGGGATAADGVEGSVQYYASGILRGGATLVWNNAAGTLTAVGNVNTGNVNATDVVTASTLTSNIVTGTAPLTVTSTTRVANLSVNYANVSDFGVVTNQTTGTFFPVFVNSSATGNRALGANANVSFNAATGALISTLYTGTLTTAAQPNVTSLGTLTGLGVNGTITGVNITANTGVFTGNASGLSEINASNLSSGTVPTARLSGGYPITVTTAAQPNITSVGTLTSLAVTGNISAGNVSATTFTGALSGAATSATTAGTVTTAAQPNITSVGTLTSLGVSGNITAANITANTGVFTGNGSALTALNASNVSSGTLAQARLANASATLGSTALTLGSTVTTVAGLSSVTSTTFVGALTGAATSATTAGTVTTAAQPNITSVGTLTSLSVSGALTNANLTTGANSTAGTITGNWTLTAGSRMEATYADLAEYYEADDTYEPGTVLMFGGEKEVTLAEDGTSKVAGVVSTNPAYVMNSTCPGLLTAVALQGRVPCKVRGNISKGDMLISGGNGFARPNQFTSMGTVIGKALQDFDGYEGVIEVAVGRL